MIIEKEFIMLKKRQWTKSLPALVFVFFFGCTSLLSHAIALENFQKKSARENKGRIGLGFFGGYGLFSDSKYKGGVALGATFLIALNRNIAIELAGIYLKGNVENSPGSLSQGVLTTMPLQLSVMGRFPVGRKLTPYLLAGGSYFLNSFAMDSSAADGWETLGFTMTEKVDKAFGFHCGVGLELALGNALAADVSMRYCMAKAKGSWSMTDEASAIETSGTMSDLKLDAMTFAFGLKYFFK